MIEFGYDFIIYENIQHWVYILYKNNNRESKFFL